MLSFFHILYEKLRYPFFYSYKKNLFYITAQKVINTLQLENSSPIVYVMSFICPLCKRKSKKEIPVQTPQIQELMIENNHKDIINKRRNTTTKYAQMIENLPFNLIVDKYDGEVLNEIEAQRACVKCYKKECLLISFPDKLADGETLTNGKTR